MDETRPGLSDAERESLRALWDHGPGTVRQILELLGERGRRWAYSTVATLLRRLEAKRYAASEPVGGALVYRAALSREELCDGAAAPLVLALVQGNRFTPEELDRIRGLIEDARKKPGGPS